MHFFEQLNCGYENVLVFKVSKDLFLTEKDILLFCAYVPPVGSPFYDDRVASNGILLLEQCIIDTLQKYSDCYLMLCGDLNARTGTVNPCSFHDPRNVQSDIRKLRASQDQTINAFGKSLLSLCVSFDLTIVNGNLIGDNPGGFTFLSANGNSVVDYHIISNDLLHICQCLRLAASPLSPHMCLEMDLETNKVDDTLTSEVAMGQKRIEWDERSSELFSNRLRTCLASNGIVGQIHDPNVEIDVDLATDGLTECLVEAADFMSKIVVPNKSTSFKFPWFDKECAIAKRKLNSLLHKYTRSLSISDRRQFILGRNKYKYLIRTKKKEYRSKTATVLQNALSNQDQFWKLIKQLNGSKYSCCRITAEEWYEHFVKLFEGNNSSQKEMLSLSRSPNREPKQFDGSDLNSDITEYEIISAIKKLKNNKATGPDLVMSEMLKSSVRVLIPYLVHLFNIIFSTGKFPVSWSKSIIVPIHKHGCLTNPDNFRGISLTSIFSKVFTHILNSRLQSWADDYDLIAEEQGGFRRGYSTIDNIYILHEVVKQHLNRKKKLYVAFIDFRKAFDTVRRQALWIALENNGIVGNMANILKGIYESVKSCVRCSKGRTEFFPCPNGLKQGCNLSPTLFLYLVNEITKEIVQKGKHGVQLMPDLTELFLLLFADDIVLIGDTVVGLQNQLNTLVQKAEECGLYINQDKSKVMVFRLGGHLAHHEKWYVGNTRLEVVNEYKYLGMMFSTKLCTNTSLSDLALRGKSAAIQIIRTLFKLGTVSPEIWFKMFDAQVQPTLLYGAEIWGLSCSDIIESVHLFFMKRYLNVSSRTPNTLVYGELGRFPLSVNATIRCVKYWLKILGMPLSRYPRKVYQMLLSRNTEGENWVTVVKAALIRYGFEQEWSRQIVHDDRALIRILRQRLIEEFDNEWSRKLVERPRFALYATFKTDRCLETYLRVCTLQHFRNTIIRFRLGISEISVHRYRYRDDVHSLICPSCQEEEEDEIHVLLQCPVYEDLRVKHLGDERNPPNVNTFVKLLSAKNESTIKCVISLLHSVMKRRNDNLSM
ncbi:MAG: hypothetical protein DSZ28_07615 [Thiothrix sp.]|nr:MAG: hypothetical protein DSZ28_07615 [Thiothrix sp.]